MTYATKTTYHKDSAPNLGGVGLAVPLLTLSGGSGWFLTGCDVEGAANFGGFTAAPGFGFEEYFAHGVAVIPHGATLENVEAGADTQQWLFLKLLRPSPDGAAWAPATDNANVTDRYGYRERWRGQWLVPGSGYDIYYITGNVASGTLDWTNQFSAIVYYGNV
jgi:hypothetical protein